MQEAEVDSDAALLLAARQGDASARAHLVARHTPVARRLAQTYERPGVPADEIVTTAFDQLLSAGDRGVGPSESFRAYLFVKVRRAATSAARQRSEPAPQGLIDLTVDAPDVAPPGNAREFVSRAFDRLSERHQVALWHATVEGADPTELGIRLNLSADAAAAVAYRAREDLRSGYLEARLEALPQPACSPHAERLDAFVRRSLKSRDRTATAAHLDECGECREIVDELSDVSVLLLRATVPLLLGFSLLTGLPPVEAPALRPVRSRRATRIGLAGRGFGSARRRSALTVIVAAVLFLVLGATAFAISARNGSTDHVSAGTESKGPSSSAAGAHPAPTTSTPHHPTTTVAHHASHHAAHSSATTRPTQSHASTSAPGHTGGAGGATTLPTGTPTSSPGSTSHPTSTTTAHPTTVLPTTTTHPTTTTTTEPTTDTTGDTSPGRGPRVRSARSSPSNGWASGHAVPGTSSRRQRSRTGRRPGCSCG
jgi:RNA polymerase sigma factor (sigma-70 family)